jgi:GTP-binding protein Era
MNDDDTDHLESLPGEELPPDHRSGYVAVLGKPNAGKSTLVNAYLGQKVAIVSDKPQTTRNRLLGILTLSRARGDLADAQIVFMDTPGIHRPLHKLGEYLVETAVATLPDADVVVFVVDAAREPNDEDRQIAALLRRDRRAPVILALNKADLLDPTPSARGPGTGQAAGRQAMYEALGPFDDSVLVSALKAQNLDGLLERIVARLPLGPRYFPEDEVTDQQVRFMSAELVREQVLRLLREEVPHAIAVLVDEFEERSPTLTYIAATIFVERDTQKAIVVGRQGSMIKRIGQEARREIEALLDTQVYLELRVKVKKGWRKNENELRRMGYSV